MEFVNRQPDGNYLLRVGGMEETVVVPHVSPLMTEEETDQAGKRTDSCYITETRWLTTCRG